MANSFRSEREAILATAIAVAEDYGLDAVDERGMLRTADGLAFSAGVFVNIVTARLAAEFDESKHPRDDRGRFGEGDGGFVDKADTHFTTAADVSFADWARQFPRGTVFRAGNPARVRAMQHGHDLGAPDPAGAPGPTSDTERIGGIWVSTTAKPEYLDKGEVMAAFDPHGLPVVNEGAPGDLLLSHIPAGRLIGMWTPGPEGARGYEVAPYHARGKGFSGVEPIGKAVTAAFDESQHPRDEHGRFTSDGEGEPAAKGTPTVEALLRANPRLPGENVFDYQGRLVQGLPEQTKSDVLFAIRETYPPVGYVMDGAQRWNEEHGLAPIPNDLVDRPADLAEADAAARSFENTPDQSSDPEVRAAYEDFKRQNEEMYDYMTRSKADGGMGVTVDFTTRKDPYDTAAAQADDLRDNHHITIQSGLGGEHSTTMTTDEYDRFRAVHDVFGHAGVGGGFDRHGEYEAWLMHSAMYTPPGSYAMSTEYHGVNSAMWATPQVPSPGTGKSLLLPPEHREPARLGAIGRWTKRDIASLIAVLHLDTYFANHFEPCAWHYDERPKNFARNAAAFTEELHPRDAHGRFAEGTSAGEAPVIEAHSKTAELVTMSTLTDKVRAAVEGKITGPVPPEKPPEGWPKDANGKAIVPQPPEGESWGLGTTPAEVHENYEAIFERGMADPAVREEGMNWYDDTHDQAAALGEKYGYDMEQTAATLAAMSAGTRWETEMPIMETMMKMDGTVLDLPSDRLGVINAKLDKLGEDAISNGMNIADMNSAQAIQVMFNEHMTNGPGGWGAQYSFNQYERALDMLRGDSTPAQDLNGIKVREFYNNISNPGLEDHVTIDVMMMRIAANNPAIMNDTRITSAPSYKTVGLGPTPILADEVRRIADANHITANDAQAIMWVEWLKEQQLAGHGGARGKA